MLNVGAKLLGAEIATSGCIFSIQECMGPFMNEIIKDHKGAHFSAPKLNDPFVSFGAYFSYFSSSSTRKL